MSFPVSDDKTEKPMEKKKKRSRAEILFIVIIVAVLAFFVYLEFLFYNRTVLYTENQESQRNQIYQYQYQMIVDNRNKAFWEEVFQKAKEEAAANNALLSIMQPDWTTEFNKEDYIDMCIVTGVDGIILEYNGENGLIEKINEAAAQGIPVITIINDANRSSRQSFVGVSDYQLGIAYAEQIRNLADENTRNILILSNREQELEKNQMYAQIYSAAQDTSGPKVSVREERLVSNSPFDVEEAIRSIFQSSGGPPQILICLDEVTTVCAYQAMIDFNMVGEVKIIGYSFSDTILDAVHKGLIPVTMSMNTNQIGLYSVEALEEFRKTGRSNSYYTVQLDVVTAEGTEE